MDILPRPPALLVKDIPALRASAPFFDHKCLLTNDALFLDERFITDIIIISTRRYGIDKFSIAFLLLPALMSIPMLWDCSEVPVVPLSFSLSLIPPPY